MDPTHTTPTRNSSAPLPYTKPVSARRNSSNGRIYDPHKSSRAEKLVKQLAELNLESQSSSSSSSSSRRSHVSASPRLNGNISGLEVHIEMILHHLDGTGAGRLFTDKLLEKFGPLIIGTQKPVENAAQDLWRICSKLEIAVQNGLAVDLVLEKHPDAHNEEIPEDKANLTWRFLLLLRYFKKELAPPHVKWDSKTQAPPDLTWDSIEDVARWVKMTLKDDPKLPVIRFLRSCNQDRYNNSLKKHPILKEYGLHSETPTPSPFIVKQCPKKLTTTHTFYDDGTHTETLEMPMEITHRGQEGVVATILWVLTFFYDQNCTLIKINSTGKRK